MGNANVRVFGIQEALGKMETLKLLNNPDVKYLLNNIGNKVKADTKKRTPVDTGELRKSWSFKTINKFAVKVTSSKEYAQYVEEGTDSGRGAFKPGQQMLKKSVNDMKYIHLNPLVNDFYKKLKRKYER